MFPLWKNYIMSQEVFFSPTEPTDMLCQGFANKKKKKIKQLQTLVQLFKVHMLAAESLFHSSDPANSSMQYITNVFLLVKQTRRGWRIEFVVVWCPFLYKSTIVFILAFAQSKPKDNLTSTLTNALTYWQKSGEIQYSENSISFMMPSSISQKNNKIFYVA